MISEASYELAHVTRHLPKVAAVHDLRSPNLLEPTALALRLAFLEDPVERPRKT